MGKTRTAPIKLTPFADGRLCHGYTWTITNKRKLASLVARLVLGQFRHVERIISSSKRSTPTTTAAAVAKAVKRLSKPQNEPRRYQRDGWVFQMISWIAAHLASGQELAASVPQMKESQKGFDGLLVEFSASGEDKAVAIICEDKATENGRRTILKKVWPEFRSCEAGEEDAELQSGITALLERRAPERVDELVEHLLWHGRRSYRVSVTIEGKHDGKEGRSRLLKGYCGAVGGACLRRRAETLCLPNVRNWMDEFCELVVRTIKKMK